MQQTNRIFYRNDQIGWIDEFTDRDDKKSTPIRNLFKEIDADQALRLQPKEEVWVKHRPHLFDCVIGYKRVTVVSVDHDVDTVTVHFKTFDKRERNRDDQITIRSYEGVAKVFRLHANLEGRLESLAVGKAIFVGDHRDCPSH